MNVFYIVTSLPYELYTSGFNLDFYWAKKNVVYFESSQFLLKFLQLWSFAGLGFLLILTYPMSLFKNIYQCKYCLKGRRLNFNLPSDEAFEFDEISVRHINFIKSEDTNI